jgi:tetratricopeptide (TPR) repeat protein
VPLLTQLIEAGPTKKTYWLQLAGVQASLGGFESAVVPTELASRMGLLTDDPELTRLAQMLLQVSIPYRAAQVLGQALDQGKVKGDAKAYELLANCWVAAREYDKAIAPMRKAADLSDNGDLYVRLAEVYVQKEAWNDAAAVLRLAFDKGKLKSAGNAQLLMGLAVYNQKKLADARPWFQRAAEHAEIRSQAEAWLRHVDGELESEPRAETGKSPEPGKS